MTTATLVLASHNRKKLVDMRAVFRGLNCELLLATDIGTLREPEETGATFAENAELKAIAAATGTGLWAIGDDSGLLVDALDGAPGVYSSRFAGPGATDAENRDKLLDLLGDLPDEQRGAHFACHLALADPQGQVRLRASGTCHGRILREARGAGGFGYDPLFLIREYHRTFAELSLVAKSAFSHRARAAHALTRAWSDAIDGELRPAPGCDRGHRSSDG